MKLLSRNLFLSILLSASLATSMSFAVEVTMPNLQDSPGKSVELPIYVSDLTALGVASYAFVLNYDPALLTATAATASRSLSSAWGEPSFAIGNGSIQVQASGSEKLSGAGRLVYIHLKVNLSAQPNLSTTLAFSSFKLNNGAVPATSDSAVFRVLEDVSPPQITSGPVNSDLTTHSVRIQWSTDEEATSRIEYGLSTGYGTSFQDTTLVLEHDLVLEGLQPSTTYHYRVTSSDRWGNGPTKSKDMTFKTDDIVLSLDSYVKNPGEKFTVPVMISDVTGQGIQSIALGITFDSDIVAATAISTDGTLTSGWSAPVFSISNGRIQADFEGVIPLSNGGVIANLIFRVSPDASLGSSTGLNFTGVSLQNGAVKFATQNGFLMVKDTQPPEIIGGPRIELLTSSFATISWETNEPGTGFIEYGESTAYGLSQQSIALADSHRLTLSNLKPATTYHYRVNTIDASGNSQAQSTDNQFTSAAEQKIVFQLDEVSGTVGANVTVPLRVNELKESDRVLSIQGVIQFDPDVLTVTGVDSQGTLMQGWGKIEYQSLTGQVLFSGSGEMPLSGSGILLNLKFAIAASAVGNATTGIEWKHLLLNKGSPALSTRDGSIQLNGNNDTRMPVITFGPIVDDISANAATVFWRTDEPANSAILYGETTGYELSKKSDALTIDHTLKLTSLKARTTYHLRVSSTDASGNGPQWSSDITFTTAGDELVDVSLEDAAFAPGEAFSLPVNLRGLNGFFITQAQLAIRFDPNLLKAISASTSETVAEAWGAPAYTIGDGRIELSMTGSQPLPGSGILVNLHFEVKNQAHGALTPVYFTKAAFNDGQPQATYRHSIFTVKDAIAPEIVRAPALFRVTQTSAIVTWETDEPATSLVEFGLNTNYSTRIEDMQLHRGHGQALTNLEPNSTYHLRIGSRDAAGNGPTYSKDISFTTLSAKPYVLSAPHESHDINTVFTAPVTLSGVDGRQVYSTAFSLKYDPAYLTFNGVSTTGTLSQAWNQPVIQQGDSSISVQLSGKQPVTEDGNLILLKFTSALEKPGNGLTRLFFTQASINFSRSNLVTEDGSFTFADHRAPVIVFGPHAAEVRSKTTKIIWETDEPATSVVDYGISETYGNRVTDTTLVTYHEIKLDDLYRSYTYHFRISSADKNGNGPTTSEDGTFKTTGGNEIVIDIPDKTLLMGKQYDIPVEVKELSSQSITEISFDFGLESEFLAPIDILLDGTLTNGWSLNISQKNPDRITGELTSDTPISGNGTLFKIKIETYDNALQSSLHKIFINNFLLNNGTYPAALSPGIMTLIDQSAPKIIEGPRADWLDVNSMLISWKTDEPASGKVEYGFDSRYGYTAQHSGYEETHQIVLSGLEAGATYHYRVLSTDSLGNGPASSSDRTFELAGDAIQVEIPPLSAAAGEAFDLPFTVSTTTGHRILSYSFEFEFDAGLLVPLGIHSDSALTEHWRAPSVAINGNRISVTHSGTDPLQGAGILVWLRFQVSGSASPGDTASIGFTAFSFNSGSPVADWLNAVFTVASGSGTGQIAITLPEKFSMPGGFISYPVEVSNLTNKGIFAYQFELRYDPAVLTFEAIFADGTLSAKWDQFNMIVSSGKVQIVASGTSALSDSGILIKPHFSVAPTAASDISTPLKISRFVFNNGFPSVNLSEGVIKLRMQPDAFVGYVLKDDSLSGNGGASLQLDDEDTGQSFFAQSDARGYFKIENLNPSHRLTLFVEKGGYLPINPIRNLRAGQPALRVYMTALKGKIDGFIKTFNSQPVGGARIVADDGSGGNAGNRGTASSDTAGYFSIEHLNQLNSFTLTVEKENFQRQVIRNISPDSTLAINLLPLTASVSGYTLTEDSKAISEVQLKATAIGMDSLSYSAFSDKNGFFELDSLNPGTYRFTVRKSGFYTIPVADTLTVAPDTDYKLNFRMKPVIIRVLEIEGPEFISNAEITQLSFKAESDSGVNMDLAIAPDWLLIPEAAGTLDDGLLVPDSTFIGEVQIIISDEASRIADTLLAIIYAPVSPSTEITLHDASGFFIQIPDGSVSEDVRVYVKTPSNAVLKQMGQNSTAYIGDVYEIHDADIRFLKSIRVSLPVAEGQDVSSLQMAEWDAAAKKWQSLFGATPAGLNNLEAMIDHPGTFAVVIPSEDLAIRDIQFYPNPFSPDVDSDGDGEPGLAIKFYITSKEEQQPKMTLKIYNLLGDLVQVLSDQKPYDRNVKYTIRWDGLTYHRLKARNGRYMFHFLIEDPTGQKEYLKSAILIK
ncbi:fibronectin type III domain-containing protein [candidate division KSB1 bacterium]|nr:fibronectin type III domain-containing protein [candidate division KSB1 bacterium]